MKNGQSALIAFPGNCGVKLLKTKTMQIGNTEAIVHKAATYCCAFKPKCDEDAEGSYTLAVSDMKGSVSVWRVQYDGKGQLQCRSVERMVVGEAVCSLVWRNDALIACSMQGNIFKHTLRGAGTGAEAADKENAGDCSNVAEVGAMDVDGVAEAESEPKQEQKTEAAPSVEATQPIPIPTAESKKATKSKFEEDSDEDFDIDMDNSAGADKKIVLKKAESESPTPTPSPVPVPAQTHSESTAPAAVVKSEDKSKQIQDEVALVSSLCTLTRVPFTPFSWRRQPRCLAMTTPTIRSALTRNRSRIRKRKLSASSKPKPAKARSPSTPWSRTTTSPPTARTWTTS